MPGDPTVTGGEVSFPVTARATRVPILDPAKLLALVKGRTVDEARAILAQFGDVVITPWPDWVTSIPGSTRGSRSRSSARPTGRLTVAVAGRVGAAVDSPRPTGRRNHRPVRSSASGLPVASPAP